VARVCLLLLGLRFTAESQAKPAQPTPVFFPLIAAANLNGDKLRLPQDFGGKLNLVLVAFDRQQQADVETWLPAAKSLEGSHPQIRYYELPVRPSGNALLQGLTEAIMRNGIPDSEMRGRTIPLYVDVPEFRRTLSISSDRSITVMLVDRAGAIKWRTDGVFTEVKKSRLTALLQ
jgi:hypothetical protein